MRILFGAEVTESLKEAGYIQGDPTAKNISLLIIEPTWTARQSAELAVQAVGEKLDLPPDAKIEVRIISGEAFRITVAEASEYFEKFVNKEV